MKKGIVLIFILLLSLTACSNFESDKANTVTEDQSYICEEYLKDRGYEVILKKGLVEKYNLTKDLIRKNPYMGIWGLQDTDADKFIGEEISVYRFIVKNHPLNSKLDKEDVTIYVMLADNEIAGGYSWPYSYLKNEENLTFGFPFLSIDGKSLEEATGKSFPVWSKEWTEKYE